MGSKFKGTDFDS